MSHDARSEVMVVKFNGSFTYPPVSASTYSTGVVPHIGRKTRRASSVFLKRSSGKTSAGAFGGAGIVCATAVMHINAKPHHKTRLLIVNLLFKN